MNLLSQKINSKKETIINDQKEFIAKKNSNSIKINSQNDFNVSVNSSNKDNEYMEQSRKFYVEKNEDM